MRTSFCLGLWVLALALPSHAGEITEEAFLSALDADHAAVRALGEDVARAEAARRRAGTLANPRLDYWREQPESSASVTNWTLAWTPPLDGRFGLAKQAADAGVAAARSELAVDAAALRRELRRVFADWSLAQERCLLLGLRLERVGTLARQEQDRARAGEESGLAARRLLLAEAEARSALSQAQAARARARAEARAWHADLPDDVAPSLPRLASPPESVDALASSEIRSIEHQVEQTQLEARLAGRFWGFPTLQVGVQRLAVAGAVESGPILAAGWSIPLFDRNQAERAEAGLRAQIAAARLSQARALAGAQVHGALDAYRSLWVGVSEAHEASAETTRVIEAATAAYRAGEASLTDLLDALRSAFDTRLLELELHAQALAAHRDLEAALGRPLTVSDGGTR